MTFEQAVKELAMTQPFTKEPVDAAVLIETLKDDVVLAIERPGSWEGSNMLQVLTCHGFFNQD
jgi:hypothetical protein